MKNLLYIIFGLCVIFTCSSDDGDSNEPCPNQPQLTTFEVSNINYDEDTDLVSATFSAEIENIQLGVDCETFSITNQGFVYSNNIQPTTNDNVINVNGESPSYTFNDLPAETTFHVRAYLTNALGTFYGNEVSFTTPESINPVYLDENGVTVKARDWAEIGMGGVINNIEYTIVSYAQLKQMIGNNEDVTVVCTSKIDYSFYDDSDGLSILSYTNNFNQDISSWDVSNVLSMKKLFWMNTEFDFDLSSWDVSNVVYMEGMFFGTSFNQDISNWDVSSVTDMSYMFGETTHFNQDIGNWDVSSVTDMSWMFYAWSEFNQDIGNWDVSSVTTMLNMFSGNQYFNQDIGNWNVSSVENMQSMFNGTNFNQDISNWDISSLRNMEFMFRFSSFNQDIGNWDVSDVYYFQGFMMCNTFFNQDLSSWEVIYHSNHPAGQPPSCESFRQGADSWIQQNHPVFSNPNWGDCYYEGNNSPCP